LVDEIISNSFQQVQVIANDKLGILKMDY